MEHRQTEPGFGLNDISRTETRRSWVLSREDSMHACPVPRLMLGSFSPNSAPGRKNPRRSFWSSSPHSKSAWQQQRCKRDRRALGEVGGTRLSASSAGDPGPACGVAWSPQPHQAHPEPSRHGPTRPSHLCIRGGSRHTRMPGRREGTQPRTDHFPLGFVVRSTQAK